MAVIVVAASAAVAAVVLGVLGFRALNRAVKGYMLRLLGDHWFEYVAMLYWVLFSIVALFFFLLFVIPFWVWVIALLGTFIVGAAIAEFAC